MIDVQIKFRAFISDRTEHIIYTMPHGASQNPSFFTQSNNLRFSKIQGFEPAVKHKFWDNTMT